MDTGLLLSGILFLGLVLKIAGFLVRDELALRLMVAGGLACDAAFYGLRPDPILQSFLSTLGLVAINLCLIVLILSERTRWRMSAGGRALFDHFPTLTPGQFRRVARLTRRSVAERETRLIEEGADVRHLYFLFTPGFSIEKRGQRYDAQGPAFVGEIAFLTGASSSAAVIVPPGTSVVAFDSAKLRRMMARNPAIHNGMVALFGRDLARKVAHSVPLADQV